MVPGDWLGIRFLKEPQRGLLLERGVEKKKLSIRSAVLGTEKEHTLLMLPDLSKETAILSLPDGIPCLCATQASVLQELVPDAAQQ
jgi:hypothetical protein